MLGYGKGEILISGKGGEIMSRVTQENTCDSGGGVGRTGEETEGGKMAPVFNLSPMWQ